MTWQFPASHSVGAPLASQNVLTITLTNSDLCFRHFGMWLFHPVLILVWSLECDVLVSAELQHLLAAGRCVVT